MPLPPPPTTSSKGTNYPPALLVPEATTPGSAYHPSTYTNPTLTGLPLTLVSYAAAYLPPLQSLLYKNAGFARLRELDSTSPTAQGILRGYAPRWDPTVIPTNEWVGEGLPLAGEDGEGKKLKGGFASAEMYVRAYLEGRTDPVEVAEHVLALVEREKRSGRRGLETAWMRVDREGVLARAGESKRRWEVERRRRGEGGEADADSEEGVRWVDLGGGRRGCVDGVLIGVKDEILVENHPLTYGTGTPFAHLPNSSAWCVQQLVNHGAIIVGTNTMHQFGLDTTNNNPAVGTPINPFAEEYYPGGSSGGGGSAVGCGVIPIAVATDGGGSVRIPAAYCGVYGLKTSHGRVSGLPLIPDCATTCAIGPIAATMHDLELSYRLLALPNPSDPLSAHFPTPLPPSISPPNPSRKKYLGVYASWLTDSPPAIQRLINATITHLTTHDSYTLIPITLPHLPAAQLSHALTILTEIGAGFISGLPDWARTITPSNRILVGVSKAAAAQDLLAAQKVRSMLMAHLAALYEEYPGLVIISPTLADPLETGRISAGGASGVVRVGGAGVSDSNRSLRSMQYVFLANLTGCPAITMPVGYLPILPSPTTSSSEPAGKSELEKMSEGVYNHGIPETADREGTVVEAPGVKRGKVLPVGMMGMGEWGFEEELLRLGYDCERFLEGGRKIPPAHVDVLGRCSGVLNAVLGHA
ncbi:amidase signature domain-containing protein [Peziza echinospora]|nr:amidase signature domain-containing protein [Peziza echinospora]